MRLRPYFTSFSVATLVISCLVQGQNTRAILDGLKAEPATASAP